MLTDRVWWTLALAISLSACAAASGGSPSGTGGSTGAGGAPAPVMKDPSNYTWNTAGAAFPYPQGHPSANCTYPIYNTDTVGSAYTNWKTKFFVGGTIIRPENSNDTVSEGIGYGMLIGVYMNDQPMFDALWTYAKAHLDGKGLMTWCIPGSGSTSCSGSGSATDGDEDMAWALLMASKQWSGGTYATDATGLIGKILTNEVTSDGVIEAGDGFNNATEINPSYFAPSYYRAFAAATGNAAWTTAVEKTYGILAAASGTDGLVPNWVNQSGAGITSTSSDGPYFGYDACRTPFRIGIDWCQNGEPRAKTYADKIAGFYGTQATNALSMLKDGYTTTGTAPPSPSKLGMNSAGMAFFGPGAVAAMDGGGHDAFLKLSYSGIVNETTGSAMNVSGVYTYFSASWGVLAMLATSGNFWDMTQ